MDQTAQDDPRIEVHSRDDNVQGKMSIILGVIGGDGKDDGDKDKG